ncbi:hypothetical protein BDZ89DRAFT_1132393 [Hymenopellis radicata]|nr:hypothetical protein BDZ89DRAFT_1132393 [Hymenopellis radicata]
MDWSNINPEDELEEVIRKVDMLLSQTSESPWKGVGRVCPEVAQEIIDTLQSVRLLVSPHSYLTQTITFDVEQKLRHASTDPTCRTTCMKCLRELRKNHDVLPSSFLLTDVECRNKERIAGGGYADIYKGTFERRVVCFKVLRRYEINSGLSSERLKAWGTEALIWGQLSHAHILPFVG